LANSFHMGFSLETVNFLQLGNWDICKVNNRMVISYL
jgi:hypothetical protein